MTAGVSVIIPAFNEASAIGPVVARVQRVLEQASIPVEVLVVDDGSTDGTADAATAEGATVVSHPENAGYGRSLKTGILRATHDLIAITDADGTYPVERLPELLALADRFDMVVGQRTGPAYLGNTAKRLARMMFRLIGEFAAGRKIPDINSGLRVFRRSQIVPFFPHISSGFSFTTTATLVYMLSGLFVHYVPIDYHPREGRSKVRYLRDTLRAFQIVVEAILRCNPIKVFLLLAAACYARSSDRFYHRLINSRWLGSYIRNHREGRGMTRWQKSLTLALLWAGIGATMTWSVSALWLRALLLLIAVSVTVHVVRLPAFSLSNEPESAR